MTSIANKKLGLFLLAIVLGILFLGVFFGGTWEGAKFGLMLLGGVFLIQTAYNSLVAEDHKKAEAKEFEQIIAKHFKK